MRDSLHIGRFVATSLLVFMLPSIALSQQGCMWTPYQNTLIYGGNATNATTLDACQSQCLSTSGCVSCDWAPSNPGAKCFLLSTKNNKVSGQNGVTHYDYDCPGGNCQWNRFPNTNIYGGTGNNATSLPACQAACTQKPGCQSVDWVPSASPGQGCYLLSTQSNKNNVSGVDHYDLVGCNGTGPPPPNGNGSSPGSANQCENQWTFIQDTNSLGGVLVPELTTYDTCMAACGYRYLTQCAGFEFTQPNQCWLHYNQSDFNRQYSQPGTVQAQVQRCPEEGLEECFPSGNDYCPKLCIPKWRSYRSMVGSGSGSWVTVSSPSECPSECLDDDNCIGFDLLQTPGSPPACRYYSAGSDQALANRSPQVFTTNYRLADRCPALCNGTVYRFDNIRNVLYNPYPDNATSETACAASCRRSETCVAAQWNKQTSKCSLADAYLLYAYANDTSSVVYAFFPICPPSQMPGTPPPLPSSPPSPPSPPPGGNGSCQWNRFPNTNIYGGTGNNATNLTSCQAACAQTAGCQSIDWVPSASPGQGCYLLSTQNNKNNVSGVDHYDLVSCNGTGNFTSGTTGPSSGTTQPSASSTTTLPATTNVTNCFMAPNKNMLIYGGTLQSSSTTLPQCQTGCVQLPYANCSGIDWDNNANQCYFQTKTTGLFPGQGVDHYTRQTTC